MFAGTRPDPGSWRQTRKSAGFAGGRSARLILEERVAGAAALHLLHLAADLLDAVLPGLEALLAVLVLHVLAGAVDDQLAVRGEDELLDLRLVADRDVAAVLLGLD